MIVAMVYLPGNLYGKLPHSDAFCEEASQASRPGKGL